MFDEENENITEPEEMTPEEESFSQGKNSDKQGNSRLFSQKPNLNSKDGKNLRDKISQGRAKNKQDSQQQNNSSNPEKDKNKDAENDNTKNEQDKPKDEQATDLEKKAATEALKAAAVAAGVPEPLIDKALKSEKAQEAIEKLIEEFKKKKKEIRKKIIAAVLPLVMTVFVVLFVASTIMTELYQIVDRVDETLVKVDEFGQKLLNLTTGNGWHTEEEQFFITLNKEFEKSKAYTNGRGMNVPLVAATIHYNYMVDLDIYGKDYTQGETGKSLHNDTSTGKEDTLFDDYVSTIEAKNFYQTANDKLGEVGPCFVGNSKLLGHVVSPKITWQKESWNDALRDWGLFFGYFGQNLPGPKVILSIIFFPSTITDFVTTVNDYAADYEGSAGWLEYQLSNLEYEWNELVNPIKNSDSNSVEGITQKQLNSYSDDQINQMMSSKGNVPAPVVTYEFDEESYRNYLRNVYIPLTYGVGEANNYGNDPKADPEIDKMINEIFNQAEAFNELFNYDSVAGESCHYEYKISDSDSAEPTTIKVGGVSLTQELMDNMKVRVNDEEISLEDYIIGVTYAESSGAVSEARKANMIAQQSFLFSRANMTNEDGTYYFTIEDSSNAQNYCNVYDGCEKRALTTDEINSYKQTYNSIKYQILYDENASKVLAYYRANYSQCPEYAIGKCMGQRESYNDENNGLNYKSILANYYTQLSLVDVKSGGIAKRTYVCYSSGLIAGNHGMFPIRASASTPADYPYSLMSSFNFGECVWYAKGRALEIISTVTNIDESRRNYIFEQVKALRTGNGNQYCDNLLKLKTEDGKQLFGTSTDYHNVKPGSVACYDSYAESKAEGWSGWYGHAMIIEDVNGNTVTVSQMGKGFGANAGYFNTRQYSIEGMAKVNGSTTDPNRTRFMRYVYLLD